MNHKSVRIQQIKHKKICRLAPCFPRCARTTKKKNINNQNNSKACSFFYIFPNQKSQVGAHQTNTAPQSCRPTHCIPRRSRTKREIQKSHRKLPQRVHRDQTQAPQS